jgi:hypothetical protein
VAVLALRDALVAESVRKPSMEKRAKLYALASPGRVNLQSLLMLNGYVGGLTLSTADNH